MKKDSEVELVGKVGATPIKTKVTDIETFKKSCDESRAGDNSGLLLRGVKREDIRRGMVVAKPGSTKAHQKFLCSMYVLTKEEGGRHTGFGDNYRPQIFLRTAGEFSPSQFHSCHVIRASGADHARYPDEPCGLFWPEGTEDKDSKMVMPGDNVSITVMLINPIAMEEGLRFAIREGGRTVGAGVVAKIIE